MTEHTPGPWLARKMISGNWTIDDDTSAQPIARTSDEANARMIAAAPRMFERLSRNASALALAAEVMRAKGLDGAAASLELDASRTRETIRAATGDDGE